MNRLADLLVFRRDAAALIGLVAVLALGAVSRIPPVDGSLKGFDLPDNPYRELSARAAEHFSARTVLQIIITPADGDLRSLLGDLRRMEESFQTAVPGARLRSLHTVPGLFASLGVEPNDPVEEALRVVGDVPMMSGMVSRDRSSFLALGQVPFDARPSPEVVDSVLASSFPSIQSAVAFSLGHLERDIQRAIQRDVGLLTLLGLAGASLLLLWAYGSWGAVLFVMSMAGVALLGGLATLSVLSLPLNVATMLVLPAVAALSLADAVHLLAGFTAGRSDLTAEQRLRSAVRQYLLPSFLTSLTTSAAFFSLMTSKAENLRMLGLSAGVSVLVAFVLVFLLGPYLLVRLGIGGRPSKVLARAVGWLGVRSALIGMLSLGFVVATPFLIGRLNFSTPPDHFFPRGAAITEVHASLTSEFFALASLDVILEARDTMGPDWRAQLARTATEIRDRLETLEGVVRVNGLSDFVEQARMMNLPLTLIANQLRDNPYVSRDGRWHRIEVRVSDGGRISGLEPQVSALLEPYSQTVIWGVTSPLLALEYVNAEVVAGLFRSFAVSTLFIVLILWLLTRTLRGSLIAILANAVPMGAAIFLFGVLRLEVSILSASVLVLSLGLIVDDTLHTLYRLTSDDGRLGELPHSMATTSLTLGLSFALFLVSSFIPVRILGGVISLVLLVAVVADLTLVPWLFGFRLRLDRKTGADA